MDEGRNDRSYLGCRYKEDDRLTLESHREIFTQTRKAENAYF